MWMWNGSSGFNLQLQSSQTRPGLRSRMHFVNFTSFLVEFEARGEWGCWYQGPFLRGMFCIATCMADSVEMIPRWHRKQTTLCTWWKAFLLDSWLWPSNWMQEVLTQEQVASRFTSHDGSNSSGKVGSTRDYSYCSYLLEGPWQTMRCPLKEASASTEPNKVLSSFEKARKSRWQFRFFVFMAKEDGDGDGDDPSTGVMIFEDFLWPHFWQNCDACHVSRSGAKPFTGTAGASLNLSTVVVP